MKESRNTKVAFCGPWRGRRDGISDLIETYVGYLGGRVDLEIVPLRRNISSRSFYRLALERINRCDLCHLQHNYVYFNGFLPFRERFTFFLRRLRVPLIITFHEYRGRYPVLPLPSPRYPVAWLKRLLLNRSNRAGMEAWLRLYHRVVFQRADLIQVHTGYHRRLLLRLGCPPEKIRVYPLPASPFLPREELARRRGENRPGKRVILTPGFVSRRKGYERVLSVLTRLPGEIVYIIAGGPMNKLGEAYRKELEEEIRCRRLKERVVITGYRSPDELSRVMLNADLILLPYPEEAIQGSAALAQALSLDRPVLASSTSVHREMRDEYGCPEIFDLKSPAELEKKILLLLDSRPDRDRLRRAGSAYAHRFAPERVAETLERFYREILAQ